MNETAWNQLIKIIGFTPNDKQREAITAPLAPAVIIAGAGTGKTAVMTARVIWLILTGQVAPQEILGLTFTNKATGELRKRVGEALISVNSVLATDNPSGAIDLSEFGEPTISTYNAFGSALLKEHALRVGYEPDSQVVVDATRNQLAMSLVRSTKLPIHEIEKKPKTIADDLLYFDDACANYAIDLTELISIDQARIARMEPVAQIKDGSAIISAAKKRVLYAKLLKEFRALKKERGFIDYADQIRLAGLVAQTSTELCAQIRQTYKVVLLDEYQDTSQSQRDLLLTLFGDGHPVTAVGDPCQAIYAWRGAQVTNISRFEIQFRVDEEQPAQRQNLSGNRRSGKTILAGANLVSTAIREFHPEVDPLEAQGEKPDGKITVGLYETVMAEAQAVAQQIAQLAEAGHKLSEIAILVRDRSLNRELIAALTKCEIPVQILDAGHLVDFPEVREILSYLEVIADPCANIAMMRILTSSRWAIGQRDLAILGKRARDLSRTHETRSLSLDDAVQSYFDSADVASSLSLLDALSDWGESEKYPYSAEAIERFAALTAELRLLRSFGALSVPDLILRIYRITGLSVEAGLGDRVITGADHVSSFIDLAGNFTSLDGSASLTAFLRYLKAAEVHKNETKLEAQVVEDAVILMTMHQAKGLEFKTVFLPGFTEGIFPGSKSESLWTTSATALPPEVLNDEQFDWMRGYALLDSPRGRDTKDFEEIKKLRQSIENRRLAYVAITRAKELLYVTSSWWGTTQTTLRGPNSFLLELKDQADCILNWQDKPDETAKNPSLSVAATDFWRSGESNQSVLAAANLVNLAGVGKLDLATLLSDRESAIVAKFQADVDALISMLSIANQDEIVVDLPRNLSVSAVLRLKNEPEQYARELVRPMPKPPARAADRGTMFHAWVEQFFESPAMLPIEDVDVLGDWSYRDTQIPVLQENFRNGPFAHRTPFAIEKPFSFTLNSRTIQGRIDAIFVEPHDSPYEYLVVDWKTGETSNPLQLELYRHAWAIATGVDPARIKAEFYHVATNRIVSLEAPMDLETLVAQLEI